MMNNLKGNVVASDYQVTRIRRNYVVAQHVYIN